MKWKKKKLKKLSIRNKFLSYYIDGPIREQIPQKSGRLNKNKMNLSFSTKLKNSFGERYKVN